MMELLPYIVGAILVVAGMIAGVGLVLWIDQSGGPFK